MKELVYAYLTKNYYLVDMIGWDIFSKETKCQAYNLVFELHKVFSITGEEAREFADSWANSIEPDIDLHLYWVMTTPKPFKSPGIYTQERDTNLVERTKELVEAGEYY